MKVLVVGASGLVGGSVVKAFERSGDSIVATYAKRPLPQGVKLDVTKARDVRAIVEAHRPDVIVLAVNFPGGVDQAERDPAAAEQTYVQGTRNVAECAAAVGSRIALFSTDYVFDGDVGPYTEDAEPRPLSAYGRFKLESERVAAAVDRRALILRTTAVYGWDRASKNIAMQVWTALSGGQAIALPDDQWTTPTLSEYLAEVTVRLLQDGATGVYNVSGRDLVTRADLGRRLAQAMGLDPGKVHPTATAKLGATAARPLRGGLRTDRLRQRLGTEPLTLAESLTRLRRQWRSDTHLVAIGGPASPADGFKRDTIEKAKQFYRAANPPKPFVPHRSRVPYAGRVYDERELEALLDSALDLWITAGPWAERFESRMKEYYGSKDFLFVNSGSTANLSAILALMSRQLEDRLRPGDEVITPAVTFPTTLSPIVHSGLVPVFVDCDVGTYNVKPELLEQAVGPRTKAMFLPHTLGNPVDLDVVMEVAERHDLWVIEDACDALGSKFRGRLVGTFGDLATNSYFPAHHITTGEGGGVVVNSPRLSRIVRSVRDWGRDCWCAPGENNSCGKRFGWHLGDLPEGYDHKYIFTNLGYNFKATDLQAALGVAQSEKIPEFTAARRRNFDRFNRGLRKHEDRLVLPTLDPRSEPSWFGFPLTTRSGTSKRALVAWLDAANIDTRHIFAGNILRQPGYLDIPHRVVGDLSGSERIMQDSFFLGVYPGLTDAMIDFVLDQFDRFFESAGAAS